MDASNSSSITTVGRDAKGLSPPKSRTADLHPDFVIDSPGYRKPVITPIGEYESALDLYWGHTNERWE